MSLTLIINPIEIPELLYIIGYHLTTADYKTCMLVSRDWRLMFEAYIWNHFVYSRQGVSYLSKHGHLVRTLTTINICDADIHTIGGNCHFVRRIELDLQSSVTIGGLEVLAGNLPLIQEMVLRVSYCAPKHLIYISRLKRLRTLEVIINTYHSSSCNLQMLSRAITNCRSLDSLKVSGLGVSFVPSITEESNYPLELESSIRSITSTFMTNVATQGTTVLARLGRTLHLSSSIPRPNRPSTDLQAKEPWRKFVRDSSVPFRSTSYEDILNRPLDEIEYPLLRRLNLSHLRAYSNTVGEQNALGILFRKAPLLEDLSLNCGGLLPNSTADCLDALTETCHRIQSLELISLRIKHNSSTNRFFKQYRPTLKIFRLKNCSAEMEYILDLMPEATLAGLERVSFDQAVYSHKTLHNFMTKCKALQYFTWTIEKIQQLPYQQSQPLTREPPPLDQRLSSFLGPWACYKSVRHIEQINAIWDQDSFEAYYQRLTQMERLVSLGLSIMDIRKSMMSIDGVDVEESLLTEGQFLDISRQKADSSTPHSHFMTPYTSNPIHLSPLPSTSLTPSLDEHKNLHDDFEEDTRRRGGWYFKTVQELVLGKIGVHPTTQLLETRQLTLGEIQYILEAFPKLRKIRYRGKIFPLDHEARVYLETIEEPRIMVIHVTQGGSMM
ncbi:hypothetical protein FBU30_004560 [Linnemannia zychae]|nr:hypothetical protein FBU30_004560 [Linnemannia zychae]